MGSLLQLTMFTEWYIVVSGVVIGLAGFGALVWVVRILTNRMDAINARLMHQWKEAHDRVLYMAKTDYSYLEHRRQMEMAESARASVRSAARRQATEQEPDGPLEVEPELRVVMPAHGGVDSGR